MEAGKCLLLASGFVVGLAVTQTLEDSSQLSIDRMISFVVYLKAVNDSSLIKSLKLQWTGSI